MRPFAAASKALAEAAMQQERAIAAAHALGLSEGIAREEIRAEQQRAHVRPRPFDWREVHRRILDRAQP